MSSKRWLYALGTAVTLDLGFSIWGHTDVEGAHAIGGPLLWLVVVVAALGTGRSFRTSDRKSARREQFIEAVGATSHDWLWETDLDGRIVYSSDGLHALLGYTCAEVVGVLARDLLMDERVPPAVDSPLDVPDGAERELSWRHRNGSAVQLIGGALTVRDRTGAVIGYQGARRPVTVAAQATLARAAANQRISHMLSKRDVDIALQPFVNITTGRVSGVEALARFRDGRGPEAWFQDAEDCGRTCDLDAHTFNAALRLFAIIPSPVYMSINASPQLLMDPHFRAELATSGAPFDRLIIEITEHAEVADYPQLQQAIDPLRSLGVRFAIDDTGAGYASLNHVLQLRPDVIKLDRTLITHLDKDRARRSLVTALVLLALDLGASVTGEGVETPGQLETLATLGVDHAQGYLLARPSLDQTQWTNWWHQQWAAPSLTTNPTNVFDRGQDDVPTSC